jgi:hypothetical protein
MLTILADLKWTTVDFRPSVPAFECVTQLFHRDTVRSGAAPLRERDTSVPSGAYSEENSQ